MTIACLLENTLEAARMLGADGIVVGPLSRDGRIHVDQLRVFKAAAAGLPLTFHRAFDLTRDREEALETLVQERVERVLTSGGAATAMEGVQELGNLVKRASGQIEIMAGGGVREETVQEIVHRSGVREVHVRGTRVVKGMSTPEGKVRLRKGPPADEGAWEETDERRIREFVRLANAD